MRNFWQELERPIVGLAPMDGITDAACRWIMKKVGNPDVMYTEFVSAEGIARGIERLFEDLQFAEIERPIVAQIFGVDMDSFRKTAKVICDLGFDGVDINMGCPAKNVAVRGAGGAMIKTPELAGQVIDAVREGVEGKIPVSVKTRVGVAGADKEWWYFLAEKELACVVIHGRSLQQGKEGLADWDSIARAAEIIKGIFPETVVLGNGDILSVDDLRLKIKGTALDGGLIGRAALGNPWVFGNRRPTKNEVWETMEEHIEKHAELLPNKPIVNTRKHLSKYIREFDGASKWRGELMAAKSVAAIKEVIAKWRELS